MIKKVSFFHEKEVIFTHILSLLKPLLSHAFKTVWNLCNIPARFLFSLGVFNSSLILSGLTPVLLLVSVRPPSFFSSTLVNLLRSFVGLVLTKAIAKTKMAKNKVIFIVMK
jgi:hypothetical protein